MSKKIQPNYESLHKWEYYPADAEIEYKQCLDEGLDVEAYKQLFSEIQKMPRSEAQKMFGDALFEFTLAIPAGTAFALFGEQTMVVTVKTADGASHEITVPVLLITEEISDFDRLVELVQILDSKCGKFGDGNYYTLADDITLSEGTYYNAFGINGGNGLATAGAGNGFAGTLDGKGHSIVGGIMAGGGLFGSLQSATVKNIHFKDVQP